MNGKHKLSASLMTLLILIFAGGSARAHTVESTNYAFVIFETTVTRQGVETSDDS